MSVPPLQRLTDAVTVGAISTALDGATVVSPLMPAHVAAASLRELNFDQAPVVEGGVPIGYALLKDLEGSSGEVGEVSRPILPNALISESLALGEALPWLALTSFLFVLDGRSISGFVVPSDINRQAGRVYFYMAVAALELELAEVTRQIERQQPVLDLLPPRDARQVRDRLARNTDANVEADVVAELTLAQLCTVVGGAADGLRQIGVANAEDWADSWKPINHLRLRVAHPTKPLYARESELHELVRVSQAAMDLARSLEASRTWSRSASSMSSSS